MVGDGWCGSREGERGKGWELEVDCVEMQIDDLCRELADCIKIHGLSGISLIHISTECVVREGHAGHRHSVPEIIGRSGFVAADLGSRESLLERGRGLVGSSGHWKGVKGGMLIVDMLFTECYFLGGALGGELAERSRGF